MMKLFSTLIKLIYPTSLYCICCGKIIDETRPYQLCNECMDGFKWAVGRTCMHCGKPLTDHNPGSICYSCRENEHRYDRGYTCTEYGSHERALLFGLKYGGRSEIAAVAGEIMYDRLVQLHGSDDLSSLYDGLVPIPMFPRKKIARGFNQAELLAEVISQHSGIPCLPSALVRARTTRALRGLSPAERRAEMAGAFALGVEEERIRGRRLLIIDDIYTTGATVDAAAEPLRRAGAGIIDFMSFASGADVVK